MGKNNREEYTLRKTNASKKEFIPKSPVLHHNKNEKNIEQKKHFEEDITAKKNKSKAKKQKNDHKGKKSSGIVILVVLLLIAVIVGGYALYKTFGSQSQKAETIKLDSGNTNSQRASKDYGSFVLGSTNAHYVSAEGDSIVALNGEAVLRDNVVMAPLEGIAQVLRLDVKKEQGTENVVVSTGKRQVVLIPNTSEAKVGSEVKKLSSVPYYQGDILYVPVSDVSSLLGFNTDYTEDEWQLNVFANAKDNQVPRVNFATSKAKYAIGEKVDYILAVGDNDADSIVEYKWQNRQERYFTPGEYKIILKVKDSRGMWSDTVEKTITIEGNSFVSAAKIPVLMYHFISAQDGDTIAGGKYFGNGAVMGVGQFKRQMEYLKNNGYNTLLVSDFISYFDCDVLPPEKSVVLIFDDGYENNYTLAYPIIKELGLKANIAPVISASLKKSDIPGYDDSAQPHLTFEQMKEMNDSGVIEIGCHSYDGHVASGNLSTDEGFFMMRPAFRVDLGRLETEAEFVSRIKDDLMKAKTILKERLGVDSPFFIYPYGRVNAFLEKATREAGYSSAFVIHDEYNSKNTNRFQLTRFNICPTMSDSEFISIISGQGAKK